MGREVKGKIIDAFRLSIAVPGRLQVLSLFSSIIAPRRFILPSACRTLTAALFLFSIAALARAGEQFKLATPAQGLIDLPVEIAVRNRYFATEGLDILKIQIDPEIAVKALAGGEIDVSLAWEACVRAALSGAPIKIVAAMAARPLHLFISRPEIRSGRDLRGRTVGVDAFSSETDYLSRIAVRYLGFEPERDINFVETGNSALRMDALRSGSIHATTLDVAAAVSAEEEGFKRLVHLGEVTELPASGIAVSAKKLGAQREQVKRFLRALLRGVRFIKQNRADTLRTMLSYLKITRSQAARAYDAAVGSYGDEGIVAERILALSAWKVREGLRTSGNVALVNVADWSLMRELQADRRKIPFWLKQYDR